MSALDREVRDRLRRFGATGGVWLRRLSRDDGYEREADTAVPRGCHVSLFVLLELLRQIEDGRLAADTRQSLRTTADPGRRAPVLRHLRDDPELTLLDCARLMMLFGDTVAAGVVRDAIVAGAGPGAGDRLATVRELGVTLECAVRGTLIGPSASATVLEILRDTGAADPHLIPDTLPAGAVMGRLRSAQPGVLAETSVTWLGAETLVVAMCLRQDPAEASGRQLVAQLTALFLEWALDGA